MVLINYTVREISTKIVYYGPGLSGKTTNLQIIHGRVNPENRGKLVSLATETDRTLFFDFFPIDFGTIGGFKVRFHFYTVPGQVFYNSTRKLVLKGADGVVFVADSQRNMAESNVESLINLKENLAEHGINLEDFPFVIQYNKRDLDDLLSIEELQKELNPNNVPYYEACALKGDGIMETMKGISKIALAKISEQRGIGTKDDEQPVAGKPVSETPQDVAKAAKEVAEEAGWLGSPTTPSQPEEEGVWLGEPEPGSPSEKEEAAPIEEAPAAAPIEEAAEITSEPIILKLDNTGKNIQTEIALPAGLSDINKLPLSLPLVLDIPNDTNSLKLDVNLSVSYLDKNGKALKP
jgi:signal recognition particle receptor subunit beta